MPALPIVEAFQVFKDLCLDFLPGLKPTQVDQFAFQCGKETLCHRIVPTVARSARGTRHAAGREPLLIHRGGILTPRSRMPLFTP